MYFSHKNKLVQPHSNLIFVSASHHYIINQHLSIIIILQSALKLLLTLLHNGLHKLHNIKIVQRKSIQHTIKKFPEYSKKFVESLQHCTSGFTANCQNIVTISWNFRFLIVLGLVLFKVNVNQQMEFIPVQPQPL